MKRPGQIVLLKFPDTQLQSGKVRPALLLARVPNDFDDWLLCMISTQLHQSIADLDEIIDERDEDFRLSGLRSTSLIRVTRLAVVEGKTLLGSTGDISPSRLQRVRKHLVKWIENP